MKHDCLVLDRQLRIVSASSRFNHIQPAVQPGQMFTSRIIARQGRPASALLRRVLRHGRPADFCVKSAYADLCWRATAFRLDLDCGRFLILTGTAVPYPACKAGDDDRQFMCLAANGRCPAAVSRSKNSPAAKTPTASPRNASPRSAKPAPRTAA